MNIKETIEMNKKPVIIGVAVVVLISILIILFVPFGGDNKTPAPATNVISKKAKITPPAEQKPVEVVKVEPAKTEAAKTDTAKIEPAKTDAVKTDTAKVAPKKTEAAKTDAPVSSSATAAKPAVVEAAANGKTNAKKAKAPVTEAAARPVVADKVTSAPTIKNITRQWAVNTASFSDKEEAEKFAAKLKGAGYDTVYITKFKKDDVNWHRVRVGFYGTQAEARKIETAISDKFHIDTPWAVKASTKEVARYIK